MMNSRAEQEWIALEIVAQVVVKLLKKNSRSNSMREMLYVQHTKLSYKNICQPSEVGHTEK